MVKLLGGEMGKDEIIDLRPDEFEVRGDGEGTQQQAERTPINTDRRQMDTDARRRSESGEEGPEAGAVEVLKQTEEELRKILAELGRDRMVAPDAAGARAVIGSRVKDEERKKLDAVMAEARKEILPRLTTMIRERLGVVAEDNLDEDMVRAVKKVVSGEPAVKRVVRVRIEEETKRAAEALGCLETLARVRQYLANQAKQALIDKAIGLVDKGQWDRLYALQNEGELTEAEVKTLLDLLVDAGVIRREKAGLYPNSTSAARQAEDVGSLKPREWEAAESKGHRSTQMGDRSAQSKAGGPMEILERGLRQAAAIVVRKKEGEVGGEKDRIDRIDRTDRTDGAVRDEVVEGMNEAAAVVVLYEARRTDEVTERTRAAVEFLREEQPAVLRQLRMIVTKGALAELLKERTQIDTDERQSGTDTTGGRGAAEAPGDEEERTSQEARTSRATTDAEGYEEERTSRATTDAEPVAAAEAVEILRRGYDFENQGQQFDAIRYLLANNPGLLVEAIKGDLALTKHTLDIAAENWGELDEEGRRRVSASLRGIGQDIFTPDFFEGARLGIGNLLFGRSLEELTPQESYLLRTNAFRLVASGLPKSVELARAVLGMNA